MTRRLLELWELHSKNGLDTISERLSGTLLLLKLKKIRLQLSKARFSWQGSLGEQTSSMQGSELHN